MSQSVALFLNVNGNDVVGESTILSMDREDSIECLSFEMGARIPYEPSSGAATGRRTHEVIRVVKRIDKSSPLLIKALAMNEVVNSGEFRFYRPNPDGDGTTQHFFTVLIENGYVGSVTQMSPDVSDPASSSTPPTEELTFVFSRISWTEEVNGATHTDSWAE